jgi:hypothetical protein
VKKKRIKSDLQTLAERQEQLVEAQRRLATHAEVVALALRSPERVPESDLDNAIAGLHQLAARAPQDGYADERT